MKHDPARTLIIVTSDEPHGQIGNSHQHYFDTIAKKYQTIFVQPPAPWRLSRLFGKKGLVVHSAHSAIFQYVNYIPVSLFRVPFTRFNDLLNTWFLRRAVPRGKRVVFWKFDSFRVMNTRPFGDHRTIYHVVDPVFRKNTDQHIAGTSDMIVVVNRAFFDHYKRYEKKMIYIPHGIRSEDLEPEPQKAAVLKKKYGDYFLVTGSINNDVNLDLLKRVADRYPEFSLLIVGTSFLTDRKRIETFKALTGRPNVHYAGVVHYMELKHYVAASRLCLVPYQSRRPGFYRNPIKITNYISQYKPVINTVKMPELEMLQDKILFTAQDDNGFLDLIGKVVDGTCRVDTDFVNEYLQEHLYENLVEQILEEL